MFLNLYIFFDISLWKNIIHWKFYQTHCILPLWSYRFKSSAKREIGLHITVGIVIIGWRLSIHIYIWGPQKWVSGTTNVFFKKLNEIKNSMNKLSQFKTLSVLHIDVLMSITFGSATPSPHTHIYIYIHVLVKLKKKLYKHCSVLFSFTFWKRWKIDYSIIYFFLVTNCTFILKGYSTWCCILFTLN